MFLQTGPWKAKLNAWLTSVQPDNVASRTRAHAFQNITRS